MQSSKTWDTNWAHTRVPEVFRYNQYNFSGYHIVARIYAGLARMVLGPDNWNYASSLACYRLFSVICGVLAALFVVDVALSLTGTGGAILAGALFAAHPQLVQDAHYARPETCLTLLSILMLWLSLRWKKPNYYSFGALSFLAGFCFSIKITALITLCFPLCIFFKLIRSGDKRRFLKLLPLGLAAFLLGAWIGMPGAFTHPAAYWDGIRYLNTQYHRWGPYGKTNPFNNNCWDLELRYYFFTLWPLTCYFIGVGIWRLIIEKNWYHCLTFVMPLLVTFLYFGTPNVFFERNLSHVLPLAFVLAAIGLQFHQAKLGCRKGAKWALGALALVACTWPSLLMSYRFVALDLTGVFAKSVQTRTDQIWREFAKQPYIAAPLADPSRDWLHWVDKSVRSGPFLIQVLDYRDPQTAKNTSYLRQHYLIDERETIPSLYPHLPMCSLLMYHAKDIHFLWVLKKVDQSQNANFSAR